MHLGRHAGRAGLADRASFSDTQGNVFEPRYIYLPLLLLHPAASSLPVIVRYTFGLGNTREIFGLGFYKKFYKGTHTFLSTAALISVYHRHKTISILLLTRFLFAFSVCKNQTLMVYL